MRRTYWFWMCRKRTKKKRRKCATEEVISFQINAKNHSFFFCILVFHIIYTCVLRNMIWNKIPKCGVQLHALCLRATHSTSTLHVTQLKTMYFIRITNINSSVTKCVTFIFNVDECRWNRWDKSNYKRDSFSVHLIEWIILTIWFISSIFTKIHWL